MGVMQVARPLKPQDTGCITYLADADAKKESLGTVDIGAVSQGKCAKNIFASKKASKDLTRSVAFSGDPTSYADLRRKYKFKKHGVRADLNLEVVVSGSYSTDQDSEQTALSGPGQNADECIASSLTKRVDQLLNSYRDGKTTVRNGWCIEPDVSCLGLDDLKRIEVISNDIEGEIVRCYKERQDLPSWSETEMKRVTRRKVPDMKIQTCGRGRPRKKSLGKRGGNSCDKQSSQDGSENGEGRTSRGRQRNGGQGNGGSGGGRRRRDDDDREDDNDDIEDDFDENNEDDDEEDDEQTGTESVADETELTPEQEAEMAQELLCLIPPKNMNCDPPEKPAKPGTAVSLHGVVLHETTGGLVVLNVRWRNKIYSGALIDVRKSRWASERIKPDPYPEGAHVKPADLIKLNGKRKGKKAKSPDLTDKDSKEPIDVKSEQPFKEPSGVPVSFKRPSDGSTGDTTDAGVKKKARLSPPPIECPEPNCGKRYSHKNGLKYHQAHAHQNKSDVEDAKPAVTVTVQRTSGTDTEPTSTTALAQQKIVVDQKPQIGEQNIAHLSGAVAKSVAEASTGSITAVQKIKTEEENAVDSIKDVKFEEAEKSKEGLPDVPKIMLEPSTGEAPTELIGASEGGKMVVARPENLFATDSQASLMPFNSRVNYAQFSPTLNPLNPQTINNSLSNALQTASTKSAEKFESDGENRAGHGSEGERVEPRDDSRSKLRLDELATISRDSASIAATVRRFGFDKDIKCEDVVPSSPDDLAPGVDLLPGSLGSHLFAKETKSGFGVAQGVSTGYGSDPTEFPVSTYSTLLYNQTRLDHATKLFTGGDFSMPENFAELNIIRKAASDVKPHFSPKLLEFLTPTQKARETAPDNGTNAEEVSTSSKGESSGKPSRKPERKDASSPSSTSFTPMTSGVRGDQIVPGRERPSGGALVGFTGAPQKSDYLQPNISVGRPIVKPASKPESITGGQKVMAGANRFGSHGHFSGDKQSEETGQSENQITNEARDMTPKNLSPTSYVDKQMIEAKTWIPKEVYWQTPSKKGLGSERTQFSPSKEKAHRDQSTPVRLGGELEKKSGSPFDHGGTAADYIRSHGTSPSQNIRKAKQSSIPYSSSSMVASGMDGDRAKQLERHSDNSQDGSDIPRFSLSGERSSSSPAENRGRPRKIRVEKTQQIPVGNAKDIESSRGAPEHGSRKQTTTCSYARTSVIHSMSTPPEEMRSVPSVKEEYISPEGKRKSPAVSQERLSYEKKSKQDYRKTEAGRIFEAEREKLKTRHVESHYANEVRNMQLRAQELAGLPKNDIPIRGSLSPGSRFQSLSVAALEKGDRHPRERLDAKSLTVSPAYGQGSSFSAHPSDIEKFRPEYLQHEPHRLPTPFASSLPDGYPGLPVPYSGSSYYGQRAGISQGESIAHQRFEQLMSSHMDAKYDKGGVSLKLAQEAGKHPHADRLRPSSRDGHSSRQPFYPHSSSLGFQSREPSSASRSPKGSPIDYRLVQRMESDIMPKDSKTPIGDSRRDARREFGYAYGFVAPHFAYQGLSSSKPYVPRLSEQRSPYKHPSEMEKSRYPSHSSSQAHSGPGGMLSANLILTQADTLGYGSVHYENRNPDSKK